MASVDADDFDDLDVRPRRPGGRGRSAQRRARGEKHPAGRVIGLHKGWVDVVVDGRELSAVYGGTMRGEQVVVGDVVRVRLPRHSQDTARIVDRLERETVLLRTADDTIEEERPVVANADLIVVIVSADRLETGTRLADRVLVAASAGGVEGAVCLNKTDLASGSSTIDERYGRLGYPVVRTSARTRDGIEELRALIADRWTAFAGHSGVGKSSLVNLILPGVERTVGEVGRFGGRHTTVSPRALPVPGGGWLVDTPGIRSFGIAHVPVDELAQHFPELRSLECELRDCLHAGEPGCAVPEHLGADIDPARYESYRRFLTALRTGSSS